MWCDNINRSRIKQAFWRLKIQRLNLTNLKELDFLSAFDPLSHVITAGSFERRLSFRGKRGRTEKQKEALCLNLSNKVVQQIVSDKRKLINVPVQIYFLAYLCQELS